MKWLAKLCVNVAAVLILGLCLLPQPVNAARQRVFDEAGLFTQTEIQDLEAYATRVSEASGTDIVIVTTYDIGGETVRNYADDFILNNNRGTGEERNTVLMLLYMDPADREVYISYHGEPRKSFNENRHEKMLDKIYPYLTKGDYYGAAKEYIRYVGQTIGPFYLRFSLQWFGRALVVGILAAAIGIAILFGMQRNSRPRPHPAQAYLGEGGVRLFHQQDAFVNSSVTRVPIPRDTGGGGSGSGRGGGGTSFSGGHSRGGSSFSGGGRKF